MWGRVLYFVCLFVLRLVLFVGFFEIRPLSLLPLQISLHYKKLSSSHTRTLPSQISVLLSTSTVSSSLNRTGHCPVINIISKEILLLRDTGQSGWILRPSSVRTNTSRTVCPSYSLGPIGTDRYSSVSRRISGLRRTPEFSTVGRETKSQRHTDILVLSRFPGPSPKLLEPQDYPYDVSQIDISRSSKRSCRP